MEKLLKSFLSILLLISCSNPAVLTSEDKIALAEEMWLEVEKKHGIQGSPEKMNFLEEIIRLNPKHCDAIRELSVAYLKRGMPDKWKPIFDRAVECDPAHWTPWRGYLYLYFYRDYQKAIADFDASDTLTPNHIDSPQGHSVDYWRGHAYLGAKDYENSIRYYQKHIAYTTEQWGEDFVEPDAFLNLAIAYYESNQFDKMPTELDRALQYYQNKSADTKYYYALYEQEQGNTKKALEWVKAGIEDFYLGNSKKRNHNEEIKQLYVEMLYELEDELKAE
jgi:tetratricopeptide (TPR) repeat protein